MAADSMHKHHRGDTKMQRIIHTLAISALLTGTAHAQMYNQGDPAGSSFVGTMAGQVDYSEDGFGDLNFLVVTGRLGYDFNKVFGLELRGGTSIDDDEVQGVEISIPYFVSALARIGWLPVEGNRFGIYGMAGYTSGELQAEFMGLEVDESESDVSYGAGAEFSFTERHGINVEYIRYFDKEISGSDVEINHIGAGYVYRF